MSVSGATSAPSSPTEGQSQRPGFLPPGQGLPRRPPSGRRWLWGVVTALLQGPPFLFSRLLSNTRFCQETDFILTGRPHTGPQARPSRSSPAGGPYAENGFCFFKWLEETTTVFPNTGLHGAEFRDLSVQLHWVRGPTWCVRSPCCAALPGGGEARRPHTDAPPSALEEPACAGPAPGDLPRGAEGGCGAAGPPPPLL